MKNQNQNNRLFFNKIAVAELNENQMQDVNGGSLISVAVTIALTIIADQVL